jgi:cystathionine beta-lyase
MRYDFDRRVDRSGTHSLKWEWAEKRFGITDVLPMWVADMDFEVAEPIKDAIMKRAEHGIFGYTDRPDSYYRAVMDWMKKRFNWPVQREWILFTPGVVPALNLAVQAFTRPGDRVIIQPPVYYPFATAVLNNGRQLVNNDLKIENGRFAMDVEGLEKVIDSRTKMLILCSPHNPVGRVWGSAELERLAEICLRHGVLIVADEIHADLIMPGQRHVPLASLSNEIARRTVTCTSPSKTFNLAGLQAANIVISNPELYHYFEQTLTNAGLWLSNPFAIAALEAAYNQGEEWLARLIDYLVGNYTFLCRFVAETMPRAKVLPLEGTYLVWLDFRQYFSRRGDADGFNKRLLEQAKVWLDDGPLFGGESRGFQRLNIACPRQLLEQGLARIAGVLNKEMKYDD